MNALPLSHLGHPLTNLDAPRQISVTSDAALITIDPKLTATVYNLAGRALMTAARANAPVLLFSSGSYAGSVCLAVPKAEGARVTAMLRQTFRTEIDSRALARIDLHQEITILTLVAASVCDADQFYAKICAGLAAASYNIRAMARGSGGKGVTAVLDGQCNVLELAELGVTINQEPLTQPKPRLR